MDLCLALRLKQNTFPVLLISRAGYESPLSPSTPPSPPPHSIDPRHHSAEAVVQWAHLIGVDGVVIRGDSFGLTVEKEMEGNELARLIATYQLACIVFGPNVSTPAFRRRAEELKLTGICIDNVHLNAW